MIRFVKAFAVAAFVAISAGSAHASVVVPTGSGWTLTAYSSSNPDPNAVALVSSAANVAADISGLPWAAPIAGSQWITPSATTAQSFDQSGADGFYTFTSGSIDLAAGDVIAGEYLTDNTVTAIFLTSSSGVPLLVTPSLPPGSSAGNSMTPTYFMFNPLDFAGSYQLNFVVQNYHSSDLNPVGLDVGAVPEPATWAMMIIGFLGLGFVGYRKSSTAGNAAVRTA